MAAVAERPFIRTTHSSMYRTVVDLYEKELRIWNTLKRDLEAISDRCQECSNVNGIQALIPDYLRLRQRVKLLQTFPSRCQSFLERAKKAVTAPEPPTPPSSRLPFGWQKAVAYASESIAQRILTNNPEFYSLQENVEERIQFLLNRSLEIFYYESKQRWDASKTILENSLKRCGVPLPPSETRSFDETLPLAGFLVQKYRSKVPTIMGGEWLRVSQAFKDCKQRQPELRRDLPSPFIEPLSPQERHFPPTTEEAMQALQEVLLQINHFLVADPYAFAVRGTEENPGAL